MYIGKRGGIKGVEVEMAGKFRASLLSFSILEGTGPAQTQAEYNGKGMKPYGL